ncbi:hypothetical protein AFEL58S_02784 [Afipia felis]
MATKLTRHCEERSDEAIQPFALDCFASLAMTMTSSVRFANRSE